MLTTLNIHKKILCILDDECFLFGIIINLNYNLVFKCIYIIYTIYTNWISHIYISIYLPIPHFIFPLFIARNVFQYFALDVRSEMLNDSRYLPTYLKLEFIFKYTFRTQFNLYNNICNRFPINLLINNYIWIHFIRSAI